MSKNVTSLLQNGVCFPYQVRDSLLSGHLLARKGKLARINSPGFFIKRKLFEWQLWCHWGHIFNPLPKSPAYLWVNQFLPIFSSFYLSVTHVSGPATMQAPISLVWMKQNEELHPLIIAPKAFPFASLQGHPMLFLLPYIRLFFSPVLLLLPAQGQLCGMPHCTPRAQTHLAFINFPFRQQPEPWDTAHHPFGRNSVKSTTPHLISTGNFAGACAWWSPSPHTALRELSLGSKTLCSNASSSHGHLLGTADGEPQSPGTAPPARDRENSRARFQQARMQIKQTGTRPRVFSREAFRLLFSSDCVTTFLSLHNEKLKWNVRHPHVPATCLKKKRLSVTK